jgi:hypothetical protein
MKQWQTYTYVSRADFEAWVELVGGNFYMTPDTRSGIGVFGTLECGVKWTLKARATLTVNGSRYYGRGDFHTCHEIGWDQVRVDTWPYRAFEMAGKGSRGDEARDQMLELFLLLVGGRLENTLYWKAA